MMEDLNDYQPSSKDGKVLVPAVLSIFHTFQAKMDDMFKELRSEFLKACSERDKKIEKMDGEIVLLKKKVGILEAKIDDSDAYERKDTAIISGKAVPPVQRDENCLDLVCQLVKDKLNYVVAPTDISVAHRLGEKKSAQGIDRRDLIVKFCRRNTKSDLVTTSRRMKAPDFFINESLTPLRQTISFVLRKAKREFPRIISGTSTIEGKNYVWIHPPNPNAPNARALRQLISTHDRLEEFCNRTLEKPLTHFLETWSH